MTINGDFKDDFHGSEGCCAASEYRMIIFRSSVSDSSPVIKGKGPPTTATATATAGGGPVSATPIWPFPLILFRSRPRMCRRRSVPVGGLLGKHVQQTGFLTAMRAQEFPAIHQDGQGQRFAAIAANICGFIANKVSILFAVKI